MNKLKKQNNADDMNGTLGDFDIDNNKLLDLNSDEDLPHRKKDEKELDTRNKIYTKVLKSYNEYIEASLTSNANNKKIFMIGLFVVLGMICLIFAVTVISIIIFDVNKLTAITTITAAITSFIGAIIIIPTQMVKYLFNTEETKQIGEIIRNIQDYDKAVRDDLYKYEIKEEDNSNEKT